MLVLTRHREEIIYFDFAAMSDRELLALRDSNPIKLTVVEIRGDKVRLGFEAPPPVKIQRKELYDLKHPVV